MNSTDELLALVKSFRRELIQYADDTFPSGDADVAAELLVQAFRAQSQLQELILRLLSSPAIGVYQARTGTVDVARWLTAHLRVERRAANAMVRTARHLDAELVQTRAALAAGAITAGHADKLAEVVEGYPAGVCPEAIPVIESKLLSVAKALPPSAVKANGDGALEEADPEAYDQKLAAQLDSDEARAHRDRYLTFRAAGPGTTRISGILPTAQVEPLHAAVDALAQPDTVQDAEEGWAPRTPGQRRADALLQIGEWFLADPNRRPGGTATKVVITITQQDLENRSGGGTILRSGEQISVPTVEQFLCTSQIAYATLGEKPELSDAKRFFTGKTRELLDIRDQGCAFPGCTTPPQYCDGHHIRAFSQGGPTTVDNGVLLCRYHHGTAHHSGWEIRYNHRQHIPEFLPPLALDPARTPLRNHRTCPRRTGEGLAEAPILD